MLNIRQLRLFGLRTLKFYALRFEHRLRAVSKLRPIVVGFSGDGEWKNGVDRGWQIGDRDLGRIRIGFWGRTGRVGVQEKSGIPDISGSGSLKFKLEHQRVYLN